RRISFGKKATLGAVAYALEPRTESRMSVMEERRTARRYDLTLPISIRFAAEKLVGRHEGTTRDISTRGLYFVIGQDLDAGSELDITLTLPAEITRGTDDLRGQRQSNVQLGTRI